MRATSGSSADPGRRGAHRRTNGPRPLRHSTAGSAGLALLFVVTGLALGGLLLMPSRLEHWIAERSTQEERTLRDLVDGFRQAVRLELAIPGPDTWTDAIARASNLSPALVASVDPRFPADPTLLRQWVVDPRLGPGVLPYRQTPEGLTGAQTNLLGDYSRVLIVSSAKRGLSLPFAGRTVTAAEFDALWNWAPNPDTQAPPDAWPAEWSRQGRFLHVARLSLRDFFSEVSLEKVRFSLLNATNTLASTASTLVSYPAHYFWLNGTPIVTCHTDGTACQTEILGGDFAVSDTQEPVFDGPILYYPFSETTGTRVMNYGSLAALLDGTCLRGVTLGAAGPRSPDYPGYSTTNRAAAFDGSSGYLATATPISHPLSQFTLAGWIRPHSSGGSNPSFLFGIHPHLAIELKLSGKRLEIEASASGGGEVSARYPYAFDTWHHVAAVADKETFRLYLDGRQVAQSCHHARGYSCGSNGRFTVGGYVSGGRSQFDGWIDEVVFFEHALSAAEVAELPLNPARMLRGNLTSTDPLGSPETVLAARTMTTPGGAP